MQYKNKMNRLIGKVEFLRNYFWNSWADKDYNVHEFNKKKKDILAEKKDIISLINIDRGLMNRYYSLTNLLNNINKSLVILEYNKNKLENYLIGDSPIYCGLNNNK